MATPFRVDNDEIRVGREMIHFLFSPEKLFSLALGGDFSCDTYCQSFSHLIDDGLSPPRSQIDPAEERRETKRQKEYINMLGYVADSEYEIPRRCACGERMIDEVRGNEEYDTLPGKRFFTCKNYEPWVIGVQEENKRLTKRVEEAEQVIKRLTKRVEEAEQVITGCRISINRLRHWRNMSQSSVGRLITSLCRSLTWRRSASNENQRSRVYCALLFWISRSRVVLQVTGSRQLLSLCLFHGKV
ncbi:hypothetical protein DY000_02039421 [Brassica cretica]|uniref:Zinc finger GRF-type domain-containing protein n=1 Tax=Brassica cretica TaxID=69181 RepID=A0ABQ7BKD8_BRACR|nr:hypothetical protein DY000_02039421 [Brassica cretica]